MIVASAPAWAVWLALGLWGVALVVGAVAFVQARRLWRRLAPSLEPLLAMFAGPTVAERVEPYVVDAEFGDYSEPRP